MCIKFIEQTIILSYISVLY